MPPFFGWIFDMLPQIFSDINTKFLLDKHILFEPKLEFENWFMKNGILINDAPSLFDVFQKENEEDIFELKILKNTDITKTKKVKELTQKLKLKKEL